MSLRIIRKYGDEILRKKSKPVEEMTDRLKILIEDMKETMRNYEGVGLAAVQVGVLKNIVIYSKDENTDIKVLINPEILELSSEMIDDTEGCLSVDEELRNVLRPKKVKVKAKDENMKDIVVEAEDYEARIICHEIDHLSGILFVDKSIENEEELEFHE